MKKQDYRTEGRQKLLRFLAEHPDCQFTVDEICEEVNGNAESGKSSVYRQLSEFCRRDTVRKFRSAELKRSVYQYVGSECDCRTHFHAKCVKCGKMEHLDCGDSSQFAHHLLTDHGFHIDCGQSVLYGICAGCHREQEGANA